MSIRKHGMFRHLDRHLKRSGRVHVCHHHGDTSPLSFGMFELVRFLERNLSVVLEWLFNDVKNDRAPEHLISYIYVPPYDFSMSIVWVQKVHHENPI